MYIKKLSIRDIRAIRELDWELDSNECPGWHVFIGDNGSGKSTVLRAASLALVSDDTVLALRQIWEEWISPRSEEAYIEIETEPSAFEQRTFFDEELHKQRITLSRPSEIGGEVQYFNTRSRWSLNTFRRFPHFSVAFGPFRRFSGNSKENYRLSRSNPELAAHLSIFDEGVALTESLEWLRELHFQRLEKRPEGNLLNDIQTFINQEGFLPNNTKLFRVTSDGVDFVDANSNEVQVENLSDGFRSILSLVFEIIRQLHITFSKREIFSSDKTHVVQSGIILIDEIDAHLHPTWQKQIGFWLRDHFPNMQFIVTTHSPLVCQAAEKGSIWKLPTPGTNEVCRRIDGIELNRILYGDILEALSTTVFGITDTRSDEAKDFLQRLATLNLKEVFEGLTDVERGEQEELRAILPTVASVDDIE